MYTGKQNFRKIQPYSVWPMKQSKPPEREGEGTSLKRSVLWLNHCTASLKFKYLLLSGPPCMSRRTLLWCKCSRYTINKKQKSLIGCWKYNAVLQTVCCLHALFLLSQLDASLADTWFGRPSRNKAIRFLEKDIEDCLMLWGERKVKKPAITGSW